MLPGLEHEWLEADGRGGFALGTALGVRTRRYHCLVTRAVAPPTGRVTLVNGVEVRLVTPNGEFSLSSHEYEPGLVHPDGVTRLRDFRALPWPRWVFAAEDGSVVEQELLSLRVTGEVVLGFRLRRGAPESRLLVRPLLSGRDYHATHHENAAFCFDGEPTPSGLCFSPYPGLPRVTLRTTGRFRPAPLWFRGFRYREELARGLDHTEDLASPGEIELPLSEGLALVAFGSELPGEPEVRYDLAHAIETERARRSAFTSQLELSGDAYLVTRGSGLTIVAGYPWFTDWGRDTFIALRGLCLATGRLEEAESILTEWSRHVGESGLLPNAFPDGTGTPDDGSVDAPLWFVIAVHELGEAFARFRRGLSPDTERVLTRAVDRVLAGFANGSRHGIGLDSDGLLKAGVPGRQLTWMDAKVGERVITPRIGKPVEIQALWLNALRIAAARSRRYHELYERGIASFRSRFPLEDGWLADVVDPNHEAGAIDPAFRPNQVFAVGGLPFPLLEGTPARKLVERVEQELLTPVGLRSLAPWERGYCGRYGGGPAERDAAYHQGTVWPWLLGPFVEAWLRVRGNTPSARRMARERFLGPWIGSLESGGLGHVAEIADGDFPHAGRGAPFQAWSLGELLRVLGLVERDGAFGR